MKSPRRQFLKRSMAAASGMALSSACEVSTDRGSDEPGREDSESSLPASMLTPIARIVLPSSELTESEIGEQVESFRSWLAGFRPVAEQNLPYLVTDVIPYGPAHPGPLWRSQLDALELESEKRHQQGFAELPPAEQEIILRRQLPALLPNGLPQTSESPHVAIALMTHFFRSSRADDLCYASAIGRQTCRGLDTAADKPQPLPADGRA